MSAFISRLTVSLLLAAAAFPSAQAQRLFSIERDSIPFFRGFSVSFDLVGAAMIALSDRGEYAGAARVNLHDQWFPTFEMGIGRANHDQDEVTRLTYKTTAPFYRIGMDWNLMKKKHGPNRVYAGFRYAFTNYKVDIIRDNLPDPYWLTDAGFGIRDMSCSQHWLEAVFGIDAQIWGPFHLGWMVRYKRRVAHADDISGNTWYVPGFGINDNDVFSANFNVILDL